jgi:hypothetical protein
VSLRERLIEEKILKKGWKKRSRELARENRIMRQRREQDLVGLKRVEAAYSEDRAKFEEVATRLVAERDYVMVDVRHQIKMMLGATFPEVRKDPTHNAVRRLEDEVDALFDAIDGPK